MTHPWNTRPAGYALPAHWPMDEEDRDYLADYLWSLVVRGESDPGYYLDALDEELPDVDEAEAHAFVEDLFALRRRQQDELGAQPTSRISQAFAELESIGVIAREDFSCCSTCGHSEIHAERDAMPDARGFVYYHEQDTERLIEDRATYLGYGVFVEAHLTKSEWEALSEAEEDATYRRLTLGLMRDEVVPVLHRHGIDVEWDEDPEARILLTDVDYFATL